MYYSSSRPQRWCIHKCKLSISIAILPSKITIINSKLIYCIMYMYVRLYVLKGIRMWNFSSNSIHLPLVATAYRVVCDSLFVNSIQTQSNCRCLCVGRVVWSCLKLILYFFQRTEDNVTNLLNSLQLYNYRNCSFESVVECDPFSEQSATDTNLSCFI